MIIGEEKYFSWAIENSDESFQFQSNIIFLKGKSIQGKKSAFGEIKIEYVGVQP